MNRDWVNINRDRVNIFREGVNIDGLIIKRGQQRIKKGKK